MSVEDYQWPDFDFKLNSFNSTPKTSASAQDMLHKIEDFYSQKFNTPAYLFPSARAGLSAIFRFKNISRQHTLFAPKWSSHCVWDVISRYANPTSVHYPNIDLALVVHKWGYQFQTTLQDPSKIIHDSVDSIFTSYQLSLPSAEFEVLSLPKILGTFCGGIVFSKNKSFDQFMLQLRQNSSLGLATFQEKHKLDELKQTQIITTWQADEWRNFLLTEVATKRLEIVSKKLNIDYLSIGSERLPCNIPLEVSRHHFKKPEMLIKRQFNFSFKNEMDSFLPAYLLPIHIGISEERFQAMLRAIA